MMRLCNAPVRGGRASCAPVARLSQHPTDPVGSSQQPGVRRRHLLQVPPFLLAPLGLAVADPALAAAAAAVADDASLASKTQGAAAAALLSRAAVAGRLRSLTWQQPSQVTLCNDTPGNVKIYWINYDGDAELYTMLKPGTAWTVDCFASHPWRVVDASSGSVLLEHVATDGWQVVHVHRSVADAGGALGADSEAVERPAPAPAPAVEGGEGPGFAGFDGVGGGATEYLPAALARVQVSKAGGVVSLAVQGLDETVDIGMAGPDALALLHATALEPRRPSTIHTWAHTLSASGAAVQRCLITRLVTHTYYARIVVKTAPGGGSGAGGPGGWASVDSRPSDALALALQTGADIYVSREIAQVQEVAARAIAQYQAAHGGGGGGAGAELGLLEGGSAEGEGKGAAAADDAGDFEQKLQALIPAMPHPAAVEGLWESALDA